MHFSGSEMCFSKRPKVSRYFRGSFRVGERSVMSMVFRSASCICIFGSFSHFFDKDFEINVSWKANVNTLGLLILLFFP